MLQRFAAAATVACVAVVLADAFLFVSGVVSNVQSAYRIVSLWCALPFLWGVWSLLAPRTWVPDRLPVWGAIFGVLLAAVALFVVNVPGRFFGLDLPMAARAVGVALGAGVYFALWMIVRAAYRALATR